MIYIKGQTALMKAAKHGYTNIVQMLLGFGADVNLRDNQVFYSCFIILFTRDVVKQ